MWIWLIGGGIALLLGYRAISAPTSPRMPGLPPPPLPPPIWSGEQATDTDIQAVLQKVLTVEKDPNVVLRFGAIVQRNMINPTKNSQSNLYGFTRGRLFQATGTGKQELPRDDMQLLIHPMGNIFSVTAYHLVMKTTPAAAVDAMKQYLDTHGYVPGKIRNLLGVSLEIVQYLGTHGYLSRQTGEQVMDNGLAPAQRAYLASHGWLEGTGIRVSKRLP